jgi:hypothetical protein
MNNSIEINLKPFETFNSINLYLIVKSYSCNVEFISHSFYVVIKNLEENSFIAYASNINNFKNMSYFQFNK